MKPNRILLAFTLLCIGAMQLNAEPLITLSPVDEPMAALASAWEEGEDAVVFTVAAENTAKIIASLKDALPDVTIEKQSEGKIKVSGLKPQLLYKRLATVDISLVEKAAGNDGEVDLFAGLAANTEQADNSDGVSSIRVKKGAADANAIESQFSAKVLRVLKKRGFPFAMVEMKILTTPLKPHPDVSLKKGKKIVAQPFFALKPGVKEATSAKDVDMNNMDTRLNLGAWFLKPGDEVVGQVGGKTNGGVVNVLYLKRKPE